MSGAPIEERGRPGRMLTTGNYRDGGQLVPIPAGTPCRILLSLHELPLVDRERARRWLKEGCRVVYLVGKVRAVEPAEGEDLTHGDRRRPS